MVQKHWIGLKLDAGSASKVTQQRSSAGIWDEQSTTSAVPDDRPALSGEADTACNVHLNSYGERDGFAAGATSRGCSCCEDPRRPGRNSPAKHSAMDCAIRCKFSDLFGVSGILQRHFLLKSQALSTHADPEVHASGMWGRYSATDTRAKS